MTLSSAPQLPLNGQRHVHVETEPGQPHRRLVFLVRHAESRWNRAKAELGVLSMLCENDHGLSEKGLAQAQTLRSLLKEARISLDSASSDQQEDPWLRRLLKPGVVYASPFTRAIETAVIGLRDILPNDRVELMRRHVNTRILEVQTPRVLQWVTPSSPASTRTFVTCTQGHVDLSI